MELRVGDRVQYLWNQDVCKVGRIESLYTGWDGEWLVRRAMVRFDNGDVRNPLLLHLIPEGFVSSPDDGNPF